MTTLRRWTARSLLPIVAIALGLVGAACNPSVTSSPSRSATAPSTAPVPSLTAVPGGPSMPTGSAAAGVPTTTETDFGRIYDALPPSFPVLPGSIRTDSLGGPSSATFALGMPQEAAVDTIRASLSSLGYRVDLGSALEDGTSVLDAVGPSASNLEACRIQVRFTPLSGTVSMSVLYGAECPFS